MHVVLGELALPGALGVRRGELVMREYQITAATLDVEANPDAAQRDCRTLDVPARPARTEQGEGQLGSPGRSARHNRASSGSALPGARGSPPRSAGEQPQHGLAVVIGLVAELDVGVGPK